MRGPRANSDSRSGVKLGLYTRSSLRVWVFAAALLPIATPPGHSQVFSFGAKVGVPLTAGEKAGGIANGAESINPLRLTAGPTMEVHLPFHLSLEVDVLWRRSSSAVVGTFAGLNLKSSITDWQVPFLAKYEAGSGLARPFVDGGVVYRQVSDASDPPHNPGTAGVSVGGGITVKLPHLRISPEIRFTRWLKPAFDGYNFTVGNSNQADLLVGVTF
jgi:hypothetical protein